jgi:hypothetical protein
VLAPAHPWLATCTGTTPGLVRSSYVQQKYNNQTEYNSTNQAKKKEKNIVNNKTISKSLFSGRYSEPSLILSTYKAYLVIKLNVPKGSDVFFQ